MKTVDGTYVYHSYLQLLQCHVFLTFCENNPHMKTEPALDIVETLDKFVEPQVGCIWRIPTAGFAEHNGRNAKLNGRITFDY